MTHGQPPLYAELSKAQRCELLARGARGRWTRSDHQWEFLQDVAELITAARHLGHKLTGGDLQRRPGSPDYSPKSQHSKRLAIDLNLFIWRGDKWSCRSSTASHARLGRYWEELSPYNRWGGRWNDGNHYERLEVSCTDAPHRWVWFKGQAALWDD
jgi:hypothetical protein